MLIVRRGLSAAYYRFLTMFAVHRGLTVVLDRRVRDRRRQPATTAQERRHLERRQAPPKTWETADYLITKQDD